MWPCCSPPNRLPAPRSSRSSAAILKPAPNQLAAQRGAVRLRFLLRPNRKQDELRDEIKGRATQTYLNPNRKWIMGYGSSRIFYYRYFDPSGPSMNGVSVFELEPKT